MRFLIAFIFILLATLTKAQDTSIVYALEPGDYYDKTIYDYFYNPTLKVVYAPEMKKNQWKNIDTSSENYSKLFRIVKDFNEDGKKDTLYYSTKYHLGKTIYLKDGKVNKTYMLGFDWHWVFPSTPMYVFSYIPYEWQQEQNKAFINAVESVFDKKLAIRTPDPALLHVYHGIESSTKLENNPVYLERYHINELWTDTSKLIVKSKDGEYPYLTRMSKDSLAKMHHNDVSIYKNVILKDDYLLRERFEYNDDFDYIPIAAGYDTFATVAWVHFKYLFLFYCHEYIYDYNWFMQRNRIRLADSAEVKKSCHGIYIEKDGKYKWLYVPINLMKIQSGKLATASRSSIEEPTIFHDLIIFKTDKLYVIDLKMNTVSLLKINKPVPNRQPHIYDIGCFDEIYYKIENEVLIVTTNTNHVCGDSKPVKTIFTYDQLKKN